MKIIKTKKLKMVKKRYAKKGYITELGEIYYTKKVIKKLTTLNYIKNNSIKVKLITSPKNLRKDDLVITSEISKVVGKFGDGKNDFSVVDVLPICSVENCNKKGCGHEYIKKVNGFGQQFITKIIRQR